MSRRQTLAPLSPSQLNAKGGNTAAPGRCAKDGGAQPAKGRKSVAPGVLLDRAAIAGLGPDRRSSMVGPKAGGPKQDPRPLNNKEFQNNCIRTIINYLTTHGYGHSAVSPKTLASPTGKDFQLIVSYLFQQLDPTLKIQTKVEDEVPIVFKRLNYPFQISKSALFAVGTPHSWPAILAALTWLVELLEYQEKMNSSRSAGFNDKVEDFVNYLAEGYNTFLCGDDERCQQLDEQFAAKFLRREAELASNCENLCKGNEQLEAELAQLRALRDPVELAQEQLKEQLVDNEKLEQLVLQDQNIKQTQLRKVSEKKADLQAKLEQVAAARAEADQLRERVAGQTINKADLHRMIMERNKYNELLATETARCGDMELKNNDLELRVHKTLTDLESLAEHFNTLANRLKLIPATSKRAAGTNFELRLVRTATSQAEFSNLDLKGVLKPKLESLCEEYRKRASQLSQDLVSLQETCTARAEGSVEKQEEYNQVLVDIAKHEAQLQAAKDAVEEKCKRLLAQAESIRAQVDEFYSAATNRTEHMEEQLSRAQLAYEQVKRETEAELVKLEADLKQVLQMLVTHKEYISKAITQASASLHRTREEVAALHRQKLPQLTRSPA